MAVIISGANYVSVSNQYGNLRKTLTACSTYLFNAVNTIVQFNDFEPTIDLLQSFYDTYKVQTAAFSANSGYYSVVRALNNHVLNRATNGLGAKYSDIPTWLIDNSAKVLSLWADMCAETGVIIPKNSTYCSDCGQNGATC